MPASVVLLLAALAAPPRQTTGDSGIGRLPLIEVAPAAPGATLALMLTGDGGWAGLDRGVGRALAEHGLAVVGLDLGSYLSARRTPDGVAADAELILRHYLASWQRERILIVGYSRGADIAPFIVNRLPADLRDRVDLVAMLGLGRHAGFHEGLLDILHSTTSPHDPATLPELEAARRSGVRLLCIYGDREKESQCRDADPTLLIRIMKHGAHHFDGNHAGLAADILDNLRHDE